MKKITHILMAFALTIFVSAVANAQAITQGTVDFSVSVPDAFDIRSNGSATVAGGGLTATSQMANTPLGITLTLADASPNSNNAAQTAAVPFRLRSNRAYLLNATRSIQDAASNADFDSTDIGMSISFDARSGAKVNTSGSDSPATGWGVGGGNTVGNLSGSATTIASGARISLQGDNDSTDNFVTGNLNFSIARQYYTPTTSPFTQQVTVAIVAAP
jgi:hypothetical protein